MSVLTGIVLASLPGSAETDPPAARTLNRLRGSLQPAAPLQKGGQVPGGTQLVREEHVTEPFRNRPDGWSPVIVTLRESTHLAAPMDFDDVVSVQHLRSEVRQLQERVLARLPPDSYRVRHRFEGLAGFSADVSRVGLAALLADPEVVFVEPVEQLELHLRQGIPLMSGSSARQMFRGDGVAIAIIDDGVESDHPQLGGPGYPNAKVIGGYDFGVNDPDPRPGPSLEDRHGTAVAGIAAGGLAEVGDYVGGVAADAKIYALKVSDADHRFFNDTILTAIHWATMHKNDDPANPILVINMSLGGGLFAEPCDQQEPAFANAIDRAVQAGITVVVSAGNDGFCGALAAPACVSRALSVGAVYDAVLGPLGFCLPQGSTCLPTQPGNGCPTDHPVACFDDSAPKNVTCYSNSAPFLRLLAPSNNAYTTDNLGASGYTQGDFTPAFGGTSTAAPYVSGAVAVLQSAAASILGRRLTPQEISTALTSTGEALTDPKTGITTPFVNLDAALCSRPCDYGDECNGVETCDIRTGTCQPGTPPFPGDTHGFMCGSCLFRRGLGNAACPSIPVGVQNRFEKAADLEARAAESPAGSPKSKRLDNRRLRLLKKGLKRARSALRNEAITQGCFDELNCRLTRASCLSCSVSCPLRGCPH